jgi:hypothetical protein
MAIVAQSIYTKHYQALQEVIGQIEKGDYDQAMHSVNALIAALPIVPETPDQTQLLFFAEGLRKRLDPGAEEVGNLYLLPNDTGQQIKMFNLMAEKFPLVRLSQEMINRACLDWAGFDRAGRRTGQNQTEITILDIGIGMGQQIVRMLELAFARKIPLQTITIIGIEPAAASLKLAQESLSALANQHEVELIFQGFPQSAENLTELEWFTLSDIVAQSKGKLIINCSFALHHIRPPSLRTALFSRLKQYSPALLTLIEPYADCVTPDLSIRFAQAWRHYGLVFHAIDRIDVAEEDKNRLKRLFFFPEIQDVLSEEQARVEQFETGEMWISRLENAGFETIPIENSSLQTPSCSFIKISQHAQYLSLDVKGYPVLSIIAAR